MSEKYVLEVIPYSPAVIEAKSPDIALPRVYADEGLRKALDGNEFDVTFDPTILAQGAEAAGITNHVEVILFSDSELEGKKSRRHINFDGNDEFKRDTVCMAVDESPEDVEAAETEANVRFWTSVLASNILDEPNTAKQELDMLRSKIKKESLKRKIGGGLLTTAGLAGKAAVMTGKIFLPAAIIVGTQVGGFGIGMVGRRKGKPLEQLHLFSERFDNYIIEKMIPIAIALADEYPVIDYSINRPDS